MNEDVTIYVDMDGVIADFDKAMKERGLAGKDLKMLRGLYRELEVAEGAREGIVFGIQHHYQSKHDGSKYVRFLRGARGQRQVNLELAALQLIYDDLRWKEEHEEAVFVDLAVDYLSHIFGMVEIVDDIPDVSFVVDLHWNWEQFVIDWRIRNEIEQCITPFMISSLIHVLDSPFNPLASLRRLERQLMANGVIPCRLLASPHYIEIKESGIRI